MRSRRKVIWAKFRVTMVAICALAILSVLFYLLTGGTLLQAKTTLRVFVPDATGIGRRSPVRVDGIDVGKVRLVRLTGSADPARVVEIVLTVEEYRLRSIPRDSFVQFSADTLIGDKYVDITSGRTGAIIDPDGELRYQPATDITKSLDLTQFEKQLRIVDALLTNIEQGEGRVGKFVAGEELYNSLRKSLIEVESGLTRAAGTTGKVGSLLYSDALYRQLAAPATQLDDILESIQSGQGASGKLLRDSADYDRLRAGAADLRKTLEDLRAGRGAGARLLSSDALYEDLNRKVAGLIVAVDRFQYNPWLTTTEVYEGLNGAAREAHDFIRDFRRDPSKMLRLKVF